VLDGRPGANSCAFARSLIPHFGDVEPGAERTEFRRVEVADVSDLAGQLSVRQRMVHLLAAWGDES
jgi:hypothetical protein